VICDRGISVDDLVVLLRNVVDLRGDHAMVERARVGGCTRQGGQWATVMDGL